MTGLMASPTPVAANVLGREDEKLEEQIEAIKPAPVVTQDVSPQKTTPVQEETEQLLTKIPKDDPIEVEELEPTELSLEEQFKEMRFYLDQLPSELETRDPYGYMKYMRDSLNSSYEEQEEIWAMQDELDQTPEDGTTAREILSTLWEFDQGLLEGTGDALKRGVETLERGINTLLGDSASDINLIDFEEREAASSAARELGRSLGTEVPALVAGTAASVPLMSTGVGAPAAVAINSTRVQRIGSILLNIGKHAKKAVVSPAALAFEGTYAGVSQFTRDPYSVLLQDMVFKEVPEGQALTDEYLKGNITDPESIRRLKMGLEDLGMGAVFNAVIGVAGAGARFWLNSRAAKKTFKNMTGQGDDLLAQRRRVEDYLVQHEGYSPSTAIALTRSGIDKGESLESIVKKVVQHRSYDEVHNVVISDNLALKRITSRNILETSGKMDSDEALEAVVALEKRGTLDETISKLVKATPDDFLEAAATKRSEKLLKASEGRKADESVLLGKTAEKLKVGLYDQATLDAIMQDALTGTGSTATKIWKAFEKSGGKSDFFTDFSQSPYVLSSLQMQRSKGHVDQFLHGGKDYAPTIPTAGGKSIKTGSLSLGNLQQKQGWDKSQLTEFLHYVRAEKLLVDLGRGIRSPISGDELTKIIAKGRVNQNYTEALADFGSLMKSVLDYSVSAGTISRKEADNMISKALNDEGVYVYIPRNISEDLIEKGGKGSTKGKTGYQALTDSGKALRDPFLDVVESITSRIYKAQANITKKARYQMISRAQRVGSPPVKELADRLIKEMDIKQVLGKESKSASKPMTEALREHVAKITKLGKSTVIDTDKARDLFKKSLDELEWNDLLEVASDNLQFKSGNKTYDVYFKDGERKLVEILDPALARMVDSQGISNVGEEGVLKWITDHTSAMTRTYSNLITKTPWFAVKALTRDAIFAEMVSPIGLLPKFRALRGIFALVSDSKVIGEMKNAGWHGGTKITEIQKGWTSLNALRASGATAEAINKAERRNFLLKGLSATGEWWTNKVNTAEMASRVGEFIVARNRGASDDFATFMAQESLVNFGKQGTNSSWRTFTDHQVFFRPTYLGLAKTGEVILNNPIKAGMYLSSMAAVLHQSEAVSSLYPDFATKSEEDKNIWTYFPNVNPKELYDWVAGGMVGEPPKRDEDVPWITFPAVHELQAIARGLQKVYRLATDEGYDESGLQILKDFRSGISPMMSTHYVTPTLLSPLLEVLLNDSKWHEGGILREDQRVPFGKQGVTNPSTGDFARRLAEWAAVVDKTILGGSGNSFFTPIQADYILNQYFIGGASYLKNLLDEAGRESLKGDRPQSFWGDNSKSGNLFTYINQNLINVFFDSPAAGRALENFAYDMNNLVSGLNVHDKAERDKFFTTLGRYKVRNYAGEKVLLSKTSNTTRITIEALRRMRVSKDVIRNSIKLNSSEKREELLLLEEKETQLLLKYKKSIEQLDPKKTLEKLRK